MNFNIIEIAGAIVAEVNSIGIIVGSILNGNNIINGVIGSTGSSNVEEANI